MPAVRVEKHNYTAEPFYQWDRNQVLEIYGLSLPSTPEVHFYNNTMDRAIVRQATMDSAGVITVSVPNGLLQKPYTITAHLCIYTGATFETYYTVKLPITPRTQPADYTLEDDDDVYSFNELSNKVEQTVADLKETEARFNNALTELGEGLIDSTLSQEGKAADAKATGEALAEAHKHVDETKTEIKDLIEEKAPAWSTEAPLIKLTDPLTAAVKITTIKENDNTSATDAVEITMINDGEIYVHLTPSLKVYDNLGAYIQSAAFSILKNGETVAALTYNAGDTADYHTAPDWNETAQYTPVTVKKGDVITLNVFMQQKQGGYTNNADKYISADMTAFLCANQNTVHTYHNRTPVNTPSDSELIRALLGEE